VLRGDNDPVDGTMAGETAPVTTAPRLEISSLRHRFGEVVAVDGLTMEVGAGEIVGLVGSNGAGKTTSMRAVMGILRPQGGEIRWAGHPVGWDDRLRFGYMPEERGLYPQMPALPQVAYFARLHGFDPAAARAEAETWLRRLGVGDRMSDRVVALSHGNQQRVQLAVALVHRPEVLILDEPFAGLDPATQGTLSGILRAEARRGAATLFSSHQLEVVERLCDRIVILAEGRVLGSGTLAELRARFPQQLRVRVAAPDQWADHLPRVQTVHRDAAGLLLLLAPGADTQAILRAAEAAGPVEYFGYESAGLLDLYRQLVAP
jgi:ABC-2 type transport system ATP-binding protein